MFGAPPPLALALLSISGAARASTAANSCGTGVNDVSGPLQATANNALTWASNPSAGTITAGGIFTAGTGAAVTAQFPEARIFAMITGVWALRRRKLAKRVYWQRCACAQRSVATMNSRGNGSSTVPSGSAG
jgi:hypothetical protein